MITIIGLGPGDPGQLSVSAAEALKTAPRLLLRTSRHPTVAWLTGQGIAFESLDSIYDSAGDFAEVYSKIADAVLEAAAMGDVSYAVPGHPLMGEKAVTILLQRAKEACVETRIVASLSYVDAVAGALKFDLGENLRLMDALQLPVDVLDSRVSHLIYQVYDRQIASEVKLAMMAEFPDEQQVAIVRAAGVPDQEQVEWLPLHELDHREFDHLSTVFVPALAPEKRKPDFADFVSVMARLRGEGGCPWDRQQTHESLKRYLLEEAYEVIETIDHGDDEKLCEELGDLMLQVLFHAELGAEDGTFDIRDVIAGIVEKLIRRHPHVFGDVIAKTPEDVLVNWEKIKATEKEERKSAISGVPKQLPALMRAHEISKKAARTGFDWESIDGVMAKLAEEIAELEEAAGTGSAEKMQEELGDILFVLVNMARHFGVDPEEALRNTTDKFVRRFSYIEDRVAAMGKNLEDLDLAAMDAIWDEAKERGR